MKGIEDTSSETMRQLLGNGLTYRVPKFQRDYSWDVEQWDDLWQDLDSLMTGNESGHYMGYLVLQTSDQKNFDVIDGQQRMTTLSILVLAVMGTLRDLEIKNQDQDRNEKRRENFQNSYIGYINPVTLVPQNKLVLNRHNDDFYRTYLVPLVKLPQRGLKASEKQMRNCFQWLKDRISKKYLTGEELARFIDTIVDKVFFTVIKVNDDLNAFRVFETLNARGVQLSASDLLKNYLFSIVDSEGSHQTEITELDSLWSRITDKLGDDKFPDFLRVYWNSKNKVTRQNDLFKAIRSQVKTKGQVFELVRDLMEKADIYIALQRPEDELWREKPVIREHLSLLKLFNVRQPIPLLITTYVVLPQQFERVLKYCTVISFRYNIIAGSNPNDQERAYNETALKILNTHTFDKTLLQDVYPNDDIFTVDFENKEMKRNTRNNQIASYIFAKIEYHFHLVEIDWQSGIYSLEHILPENAGTGWEQFDEAAYERSVNRLGNLTLVEEKLNRNMGNVEFDVKRSILDQSNLGLNKAIAKNIEWTEESISKRQRELARAAKTIWRLDF